MKIFKIIFAVVIFTGLLAVAAEMEERTIGSDHAKITISVPKDWPAVQTHHTSGGRAYYQFSPANTNYSIQLYLNEPLPGGTNAEERIERSLAASLKPLVANSVECKMQFVRFGKDKES